MIPTTSVTIKDVYKRQLSSYRKISQALTIHLQRKLPSHLSSHKGMRDAISVSYTHLDVYKRQIETTGLSRNSTYLYLIGAVGIEDETWNFYQWMAENASEEETILRIFSQFLQQCDLLISYNGDRFDQPYLEARYEKYGIPSPFTGKQSLDLYLTLMPLCSLGRNILTGTGV